MRLDDTEVRAAYYGLSECVRQRNLAGRSLPLEVEQLFGKLHDQIRLSRARQESCSAAEDASSSEGEVFIGSAEAAQMLNCSKRHVQRHAREIGGQLIGGRLAFRHSEVRDFAERTAANGVS